MRILFTVPHFFRPRAYPRHGSESRQAGLRIRALSGVIAGVHQTLGKAQVMIDIARRATVISNERESHDIAVVVCTTGDSHLLTRLPVPRHLYTQHATRVEPKLLGFECQAVLRDSLDEYDYFCFMEDDLLLTDPWFFEKCRWFTRMAGEENLLQPNRFEVSIAGPVRKAYIDGDLLPRVTEKFQDIGDCPEIRASVMDMPLVFRRPLNPHSGCYFLSAAQMEHWAKQPHFLDRDTSFVGPLESAATLGVLKTFRIYKPDVTNASFLEIQHFGSGFLSLIGKQIRSEEQPRAQEALA